MLSPSGSSSYPLMAVRPVGQKIPSIYRDRISQFTATGQYEEQNLWAFVIFKDNVFLSLKLTRDYQDDDRGNGQRRAAYQAFRL